jgi:hypothetical protein
MSKTDLKEILELSLKFLKVASRWTPNTTDDKLVVGLEKVLENDWLLDLLAKLLDRSDPEIKFDKHSVLKLVEELS